MLNHGKVRVVYHSVYSELYPHLQIKHLPQQIDIRWGCKFEAVDFITDKPPVILEILIRVTQNPRGHDPKHVEQAGDFCYKLTTAKQNIGLVTLSIYLAEMFFMSKEIQCKSVNWKDVQYEVVRTRQSVSVIDDDQLQAKVNEYCDKMDVPLELTLTMPIHQTRSTSSNSAANSVNNQIFNLNSYMKSMIE